MRAPATGVMCFDIMNSNQDLTKGCADKYPLHGLYIFRNEDTFESIAICDHDFEPILEALSPGPDGWEGLAYEYHCNETWKEAPWHVCNVDLAYNQVVSGAKV
ncbi:hypothetical protein ONV78_28950 [Hahella sp. CR1]|uniref:hypothetical protein n=1 Tax=Hahella sp. CR1 TaxID=2992807 RepID=UPI0024432CCB|nr:hypothetical protein [Hahella sp. CR1]MDG9671799.1 hypothetical protein [Hahella sp. CR1]